MRATAVIFRDINPACGGYSGLWVVEIASGMVKCVGTRKLFIVNKKKSCLHVVIAFVSWLRLQKHKLTITNRQILSIAPVFMKFGISLVIRINGSCNL